MKEKTIYMYHCFYYVEDDEYGHICEYNHEIVFFNNKKDAQEYKEDFESNPYRLDGQYTYYSGGIKTINNENIY